MIKIRQLLQYLLLALMVVGVFAAMARNSYGFTFIGVACFGLAFLYLTQLMWKLIEDHTTLERADVPWLMESFLLALLVLLFGFRAFYIRLPHSDILFISLCGLLIYVYSAMGWNIYKTVNKENTALAKHLPFFYSAILLFILSLGIRIINPGWSVIVGLFGAVSSAPFIFSVLLKKKYDYSNGSVTLFQFVVKTKNKAGLLFMFFILSGVYIGLSNFNIIPAIENAERPQAYIQLVNDAESGVEKPVNDKYRHEIYKEAMDKFLKRHANK